MMHFADGPLSHVLDWRLRNDVDKNYVVDTFSDPYSLPIDGVFSSEIYDGSSFDSSSPNFHNPLVHKTYDANFNRNYGALIQVQPLLSNVVWPSDGVVPSTFHSCQANSYAPDATQRSNSHDLCPLFVRGKTLKQ